MSEGSVDILGRVLEYIRGLKGVLALAVLTLPDREALLRLEREEEERDFLGFKRYNEGLREALHREYTVALAYRGSVFPMPHKPPVKLLYREKVVGELLYECDKPSHSGRAIQVFKGFFIYPDRLPRSPSEKMLVKLVYLKRVPEFMVGLPWIENPVYGEPSPSGHRFILDKLKVTAEFDDLSTGLIGFNLKKL